MNKEEMKQAYELKVWDIEYNVINGVVSRTIDGDKKLTVRVDPNKVVVIDNDFIADYLETIDDEIVVSYGLSREYEYSNKENEAHIEWATENINELIQEHFFSEEQEETLWEYEIMKDCLADINEEWNVLEVVFTREYSGVKISQVEEILDGMVIDSHSLVEWLDDMFSPDNNDSSTTGAEDFFTDELDAFLNGTGE